jgi:hypothetical protein
MMKVRVMKIILVFLIFAMTTNTPVLASTARQSLLLFSFHSQNSVIPTNTGIQFLAIPLKTGIGCLHLSNIQSISIKIKETKGSYNYSAIPVQTRIQKIKSIHCIRSLPPPTQAIIITNPPAVTLNCVGSISIQALRLSSNNLSDIFIPPR